VQASLLGIAKKAKSDKRYRFRNLYRELNEELLWDSWRLLRKDAALGVDRVSAAAYEAAHREHQGIGGTTEAESLPGQAGKTALHSESLKGIVVSFCCCICQSFAS
jgi:hypothetical protein